MQAALARARTLVPSRLRSGYTDADLAQIAALLPERVQVSAPPRAAAFAMDAAGADAAFGAFDAPLSGGEGAGADAQRAVEDGGGAAARPAWFGGPAERRAGRACYR